MQNSALQTSWRAGSNVSLAFATATAPRVSLVIPTLNEAENLRVLLPRLPNWVQEIIIVDGHSTDGTPEVARSLRSGQALTVAVMLRTKASPLWLIAVGAVVGGTALALALVLGAVACLLIADRLRLSVPVRRIDRALAEAALAAAAGGPIAVLYTFPGTRAATSMRT